MTPTLIIKVAGWQRGWGVAAEEEEGKGKGKGDKKTRKKAGDQTRR